MTSGELIGYIIHRFIGGLEPFQVNPHVSRAIKDLNDLGDKVSMPGVVVSDAVLIACLSPIALTVTQDAWKLDSEENGEHTPGLLDIGTQMAQFITRMLAAHNNAAG